MMTPLLLTHATCGSLELATTQIFDLCNNPMCVQVDYPVLGVFLKQGAAFTSNGFMRSFVKLAKIFGVSVARYPGG
jgi:hypothetical protein